jgi:hypothetical protein
VSTNGALPGFGQGAGELGVSDAGA